MHSSPIKIILFFFLILWVFTNHNRLVWVTTGTYPPPLPASVLSVHLLGGASASVPLLSSAVRLSVSLSASVLTPLFAFRYPLDSLVPSTACRSRPEPGFVRSHPVPVAFCVDSAFVNVPDVISDAFLEKDMKL
ncbi:hypothetical protein SAY87_027221 [Trapa incisa]|uniref:Uncharacterized protein n=1 Tax=Trapa incisa TaxID=236973 RepID=A0AAN7H4H3_9MYRT|nr:hypothetical protein SAY87_027221 [Trapa incisa]